MKEYLNGLIQETQIKHMKSYANAALKGLNETGLAHIVAMAAEYDEAVEDFGEELMVLSKHVLDGLDAIAAVASPWYLSTWRLIRLWSRHFNDNTTTQGLQNALAAALREHQRLDTGVDLPAGLAVELQRTLGVLRVFNEAVLFVTATWVAEHGVDLTMAEEAAEAVEARALGIVNKLSVNVLGTFLRNHVRAICDEITKTQGGQPFLIPIDTLVPLLRVLFIKDNQRQFNSQNWLTGSMYFVGGDVFVDIVAIMYAGGAAARKDGLPEKVQRANQSNDIKMRFNYHPKYWQPSMNIILPHLVEFLKANQDTSLNFKFDVQELDATTQCGKQFDFYLSNTKSMTAFLNTSQLVVAQFATDKHHKVPADNCRMAVISKETVEARLLDETKYERWLQENKLRDGVFLKNYVKWEFIAIPPPKKNGIGLFFRLDQLFDVVYFVVHNHGVPGATEMYNTLQAAGGKGTILEFLEPIVRKYMSREDQHRDDKQNVGQLFLNFSTSALANVTMVSADP